MAACCRRTGIARFSSVQYQPVDDSINSLYFLLGQSDAKGGRERSDQWQGGLCALKSGVLAGYTFPNGTFSCIESVIVAGLIKSRCGRNKKGESGYPKLPSTKGA